jgi:hypothetical protein
VEGELLCPSDSSCQEESQLPQTFDSCSSTFCSWTYMECLIAVFMLYWVALWSGQDASQVWEVLGHPWRLTQVFNPQPLSGRVSSSVSPTPELSEAWAFSLTLFFSIPELSNTGKLAQHCHFKTGCRASLPFPKRLLVSSISQLQWLLGHREWQEQCVCVCACVCVHAPQAFPSPIPVQSTFHSCYISTSWSFSFLFPFRKQSCLPPLRKALRLGSGGAHLWSQHVGGGGRWISESEASLVDRGSSRTARTTLKAQQDKTPANSSTEKVKLEHQQMGWGGHPTQVWAQAWILTS